MKKDIDFPPVEGVSVAIARNKTPDGSFEWRVYLLNHNGYALKNVLITSKGYGLKDGESQKTSTLRHLIDEVEANSFSIIERIDPSVFHLCSEYWVSYYIGVKIYDKKFIFLPESIIESNLFTIEMLDLEGVLHR
ncbi:MAG TPA: hypothetical protein DCM08_02390 [Microscillaceae bacterium]|nr:hypothetical protein [Microscillaceae bacterium]